MEVAENSKRAVIKTFLFIIASSIAIMVITVVITAIARLFGNLGLLSLEPAAKRFYDYIFPPSPGWNSMLILVNSVIYLAALCFMTLILSLLWRGFGHIGTIVHCSLLSISILKRFV